MKKGKVYLHDCYAGLLTENENGFTFVYDPSFLQSNLAEAAKIAVVPHGLIRFADGLHYPTNQPLARWTESANGGHVSAHRASYRIQIQRLIRTDSQGYQKILISPAT